MAWSALAAAGLGAASNIAGGFMGNRAAAAESGKARAFQYYMATHAYQLAVKDLKKAGLNPMLAYTQGGATAPSTVAAQQKNPMADAANSAVAAARITEELNQLRATTKKLNTDAALNVQLEKTAKADEHLKSSSAKQVHSQRNQIELNNQLIKAQIPKAKLKEAAEEMVYGRAGKLLKRLDSKLFGGVKNRKPPKPASSRFRENRTW